MSLQKKIYKRNGDMIIGMVLAIILFSMFIIILFENRILFRERNEQKQAVEELALIGKAVNSYIMNNRQDVLSMDYTTLEDDASIGYKYISTKSTKAADIALLDTVSQYLPGDRDIRSMQNVYGDKYHIVFIRSQKEMPIATGTESDETETEIISNNAFAYVLAFGGERHTNDSEMKEKWIQGGVRNAVQMGGASFGFVEDGVIKGGNLSTSIGLPTSAIDGTLAYFIGFNLKDMASQKLMRYQTGDNEDNTMHTDFDMRNQNLLHTRYLETQSLTTATFRFDSGVYTTVEDARRSCEEDWYYVKSKEGAIYTVSADGNVMNGANQIGTIGMNDAPGGKRVHIVDGEDKLQVTGNLGRLYYITPNSIEDDTQNIQGLNTQLAICRLVNGKKTLAFLGDTKTEDRTSFMTTVSDGDLIPKFRCPGDATAGVGGKWMTSTQNQEPRLFIMPQTVSSGYKSLTIQGMRAWLEESGEYWKARVMVLVNIERNGVNVRSYWVGTEESSSATATSAGYITPTQLRNLLDNTSVAATDDSLYFRAVVMGICSSKAETF